LDKQLKMSYFVQVLLHVILPAEPGKPGGPGGPALVSPIGD